MRTGLYIFILSDVLILMMLDVPVLMMLIVWEARVLVPGAKRLQLGPAELKPQSPHRSCSWIHKSRLHRVRTVCIGSDCIRVLFRVHAGIQHKHRCLLRYTFRGVLGRPACAKQKINAYCVAQYDRNAKVES